MAIKSKIVLVSVKTIFVRMKHLQNQTANAIALKWNARMEVSCNLTVLAIVMGQNLLETFAMRKAYAITRNVCTMEFFWPTVYAYVPVIMKVKIVK